MEAAVAMDTGGLPATSASPVPPNADSPMPDEPPDVTEPPNPSIVRINSRGSTVDTLDSSDSAPSRTMENVEPANSLHATGEVVNVDGNTVSQAPISSSANSSSFIPSAASESTQPSEHSGTNQDSPIYPEDTSIADPWEIREIESIGEHSALDESHWHRKTFKDLEDPDYKPLATGTIDWVIANIHGTKGQPSPHLVMQSEAKDIGGHYWRLRLYPKGNSTTYMSVYLECDTFKQSTSSEIFDFIEPALPAVGNVDSKPYSLRPKRIPVQFCVIMYNPAEPRVWYHKIATHGFSKQWPDRGFSRFGPTHISNLSQRLPKTRQAILQNDKLGFKVYLRVYSDPTGNLFRQTSDIKWHNFRMTGIHGLSTPWDSRATNIVSALSAWCLLAPFRKAIYSVKTSPSDISSTCPKPLVLALQRLLYSLRMPNESEKSAISLDIVRRALAWHGAHIGESFDVIQVFEILRSVLEKELRSTPFSGAIEKLFSPGGFRARMRSLLSNPVGSIQESVSQFPDDYAFGTHDTWPQVLQIEIPRQAFVETTREWKKVNNKVKLNQFLNFKEKENGAQASYLLYGFVFHHAHIRWGHYGTIIRPNGRDWYKFAGPVEGTSVVRLTPKQALDTAESFAYLAIYVRCNLAADYMVGRLGTINGGPEASWSPSDLVLNNPLNTDVITWTDAEIKDPATPLVLGIEYHGEIPPVQPSQVELKIFFSYQFDEYSGPGIADFFWRRVKQSDPIQPYVLTVDSNTTLPNLKSQLALRAGDEDQSLCWVWALDFRRGNACHPVLRGLEDYKRATMATIATSMGTQFWVHFQKPRDVMITYGYTSAFSRIVAPNPDNASEASMYVFLKLFDVHNQTMFGVGSSIVRGEWKLETLFDPILQKITGHDKFEYYEESDSKGCHVLERHSQAFEKGVRNGVIIVGQPVLKEEKENEVLLKGGLVQPTTFIDYLYQQGNRLPVVREAFSLRTHAMSIEAGLPDASYQRDYFGGDYHIGHLSRGCLHGKGKHVYLNGDEYFGTFKMGVRNGEGTMVFASGNTYTGEWFDDKMHGHGKYVEVNSGNAYEGGFKNGKKHGQGVTTWARVEHDERICMICMENEQDSAFYDCGHVCACMECAREVKRCPVCRKEGVRAMRIYF